MTSSLMKISGIPIQCSDKFCICAFFFVGCLMVEGCNRSIVPSPEVISAPKPIILKTSFKTAKIEHFRIQPGRAISILWPSKSTPYPDAVMVLAKAGNSFTGFTEVILPVFEAKGASEVPDLISSRNWDNGILTIGFADGRQVSISDDSKHLEAYTLSSEKFQWLIFFDGISGKISYLKIIVEEFTHSQITLSTRVAIYENLNTDRSFLCHPAPVPSCPDAP